jgi:cysteine desulfurase
VFTLVKTFFDNSATTRIDPRVLEEMIPYYESKYGNPSSLHSFGEDAKEGMDLARTRTAKAIGASPDEIFFTSGGTESNNIALQGIAFANRGKGNHIITSSIEHHAILHTCEFLERVGFEVTYLPVDREGLVDPEMVRSAMRDDTLLVSIMTANNEIGTIQSIGMIGRIAHDAGVPFHTDAVQAIAKIPLDVGRDPIDLLSISAHKFHGPKGVGALFVRGGLKVRPLAYGGGQERGLRPSTENVPGIVGMGKAIEIGMEEMESSVDRMTAIRDGLIEGTLESVQGAYLNGHRARRLCNNANFRFNDVEGEALVLSLDYLGFATSTGSACSARSSETSHVLKALGLTPEQGRGALRVSLSKMNTIAEADSFVDAIEQTVKRLRSLAPLGAMKRSTGG